MSDLIKNPPRISFGQFHESNLLIEIECKIQVANAPCRVIDLGKMILQSGFSIRVHNLTLGAGHFAVIAGPCAVESEEQTVRIAKAVKDAGAHILRGGAYKPRSSPYSFQGLGLKGLKILEAARQETGLPIVSEVLDVRDLGMVYKHVDILQIGTRNMQNFALLREVGRMDKPVLLKRGMAATIDEWLFAAEYILNEGNSQVILCERGIRGFDRHSRYLTDLGAVPIVRGLSHLPVIVDPSHGSGRADLVGPLARASLAVGAQGVMIEVHDRPHEALCDAKQAVSPKEFKQIVSDLKKIAQPLNVKMLPGPKLELKKPAKSKAYPYAKNSHSTWA
jgi:3-deoxy-7-phosphoheptulonate synthase